MNTIPLTFRSAPFPEGYKANPEQFKNDLVARLYAESSESISFFAAGPVMPSSDIGPWLKDYVEWMVWSDTLGTYVPQRMSYEALKYIPSATAPDENLYTLWIELNGSGQAIDLKYFSGGSWKSVFEGQFADLAADIAAIETDLDTNYYTKPETDTAISNSAAATLASAQSYTDTSFNSVRPYPAQGVRNAQVIAVNGLQQKILFNTAPINPSPSPFDTIAGRYVCPVNGVYLVALSSQFENDTGVASDMEVIVGLYKSGFFVGNGLGDIDNTPSPAGDRWSPSFSGLVAANAGEYFEVFVQAQDGTNTGNIDLAVAQLSVSRVFAI